MEDNIKLYSLSLDVSTTNVGISLWDENGQLIELKHLELKIDKDIVIEDRYIYKTNLFIKYFSDFKKRIKEEYNANITNIFIEAPLSNTPKNINTTAMLLGFNGIVCYKLYELFNIIPKKITVYEARKIFLFDYVKVTKKRNGEIKETLSIPKNIDKKMLIWEKVSNLEPSINWFYTRNKTLKNSSFDMADSFVVGICGLIGIGILNYSDWKTKYLKLTK